MNNENKERNSERIMNKKWDNKSNEMNVNENNEKDKEMVKRWRTKSRMCTVKRCKVHGKG